MEDWCVMFMDSLLSTNKNLICYNIKMSKEFPEINESEKTNAAIEAMKRGFQKAKGSSLGDVRRAAQGITESPMAMTEAEKEMAEVKFKKSTEIRAPKIRTELPVGFKNKEEILRDLGGTPKYKTPTKIEVPILKREFKDREESMQALYEEAAPKEEIPMAKTNEIPGVEIPKAVVHTKKKSKSFWGRIGEWLMS